MSNLPWGAEYRSDAPWNQSDPDYKEFDIEVTQTLRKSVKISTSNYEEEWDEDYDDEGGRHAYRICDTSNVDWQEEYSDNNHYTPQELIELFGKYLRHMLGEMVQVSVNPSTLKRLIQECENWEEDDIEFEEP